MGSGKTSTGRPLAERLGYGFVDADAVIEQVAGCTISEIFERDGEEEFRSLETQVMRSISERHSLVVATGGGVVTRTENWGMMHQGIVIWLDVERRQLLQSLQRQEGLQKFEGVREHGHEAAQKTGPANNERIERQGGEGTCFT